METATELKELIRVTEYRWSALVLRELWRTEGSKFVTLVRVLQANDGAIRRTLARLRAAKWVCPNPGYGHPSRPEYILTEAGIAMAKKASALLDALEANNSTGLLTNRWALPLLFLLKKGPVRHSGLKEGLGSITARSLSLALKQLQSDGLVLRNVTEEQPPQVWYRLSERGTHIAFSLR